MIMFKLVRYRDETGVSGIGVVAEGVIFEDNTVAMRWLTATKSTAFYDCIEDVKKIHGHDGATEILFLNAEVLSE